MFNILDLFASPAVNLLTQPVAEQQNMLTRRPDPKNYPIAGPQPAPAPVQMAQAAPVAPVPQQDPSFGDRYRNFWQSDFGAKLGDTLTGWAMGSSPQESIAMGAKMAALNGGERRQTNQTVDWLKSRGIDEQQARLLAANPTALGDYLKSLNKPQEDELINAGGSLYNKSTGEWIQPPAGSARQTEYGLNLVYGKDQTGNTVAYQLSKDGTFKPFEPPAGVELTPGITSSDLGTSIITRNNKTGEIIDTQAKDVMGTEAQKGQGQALSDAQVALPGIETSAKYAMDTIDRLSTDPYLPNMLGPFDSRTPNLTTDAARVQGYMNQLKGQAFLQAFTSLKGGGAITEIEGQKAEQAIARLDAAQSETDYKKALNELRDIMDQGLQNARRKAGVSGSSAAPSASQTPMRTTSGIQFSVEP